MQAHKNMVITRLGAGGLKIESKGASLVLLGDTQDFRDKGSIVAMPLPSKDTPKILEGANVYIDTPGEYDTRGFFVSAVALGASPESRVGLFMITVERRTVCFFTTLVAEEVLSESELEALGTITVLGIPIKEKGMGDTEAAAVAAQIVNRIEPHVVVPVGEQPAMFLKEMGVQATTPQKKLIIKEKDVFDEEKTQIYVLEG